MATWQTYYYRDPDGEPPTREVAGRFSIDAAEVYESQTYWDGRNTRQCATRSQWDHETLYRTAGGRWVMHSWSAWQGREERWELVHDDTVEAWCLRAERHDVLERYWPEWIGQEVAL